MDDSRFLLLEKQVEEQGRILQEMRDVQNKIAEALLGSLDDKVGLIERSRIFEQNIDTLNKQTEINTHQINDLVIFKRDTKRLAAGIALVVPMIFELVKWIGGFFLNLGRQDL